MKKIKLMPDYQCYPLWNMSSDEYRDIDPASLPISSELQMRLERWAQVYDETLDRDYPPNSGFKTKGKEDEFKAEGRHLAECLQAELGLDYIIILQV